MKKISLVLAIAGFISTAAFAQEAPKAAKTQPAEKAQQNEKTLPSLKKVEPVPVAKTNAPVKRQKTVRNKVAAKDAKQPVRKELNK